MLVADHLVKRFAGVTAVNDVSLRVDRGSVFGLLGPNGAGKTTTIRMLRNIITPDSGAITLDGEPITEATKNRVGYVPEERGLYRKGLVLETILYFAMLKGMAPAAAKDAAMRWLTRFGLEDRAKRRIEELSKGNQQKVQFIVSVIHDPDVLVLDEPFSGLDPVNQEVLKEIIAEHKRANKGIIFSTHMMEQAEELCADVCVINRGEIALHGTLEGVRAQFGKNMYRLEFTGDGAFLATLPGVAHVAVSHSSAEITVRDGTTLNEIVRAACEHVALRKAEALAPSLHAIFLDVVGANVAEVHPQ